jgi:ubiquinone/menaquinone biosynthesis C-methylase UbiE
MNVRRSKSDMSKTEFDPNQFKIGQRKSWDSVAVGWQKWWKTIEIGAQKISDKLVELAEIKPGNKVLDIATGIGEPAITAAKLVGKNGHVLATDISPQMLAIGRERAISQGLQNIIDFREGDAELVNLPSSAFEAALSRWGLMFLPNLRIALSNVHRSLVGDGRLAAAVWGEPSKVPFIDLPLTTVSQQLNITRPTQIPGPCSLADVGALKNSLVQEGFGDLYHESVEVIFEFDSPEDYVRCIQDTAPVNQMLANESEKRKEEIWKVLNDHVRTQYTDNTGRRVKLENEAICITGRKR